MHCMWRDSCSDIKERNTDMKTSKNYPRQDLRNAYLEGEKYRETEKQKKQKQRNMVYVMDISIHVYR